MTKTNRKGGPHPAAREPSLPLRAALAAAQGLFCAFLSLLACAWLYCRVDLPDHVAPVAALCCAGLGAAVAAFSLARRLRQGGLWIGLACGGICFALFAGAALLNGQREFTLLAGWKLGCLLVFGALGGVLGVGGGESARRPTG